MNLSVYDGARWVSITPHAFSHAIGGKDELIPEAIGAASTLFVEDAIAAHLDETDPHPQYLTQSEGDTLYAGAGAFSTHVAASDPHPQYLTQSEGDTLYAGAGAISDHVAASDPHPQYLTQGEGDTLYAGASAFSTHVAASDPHPQYLTQGEGDTLYAPNNAIASHLAVSNPHSITPTLIGAAPTSHTHTGAQISGNISGNAANVTGIVAIANGGTGASTAAAALTNLGAAAASHTHTQNQHIILPYRLEFLTTQSRIDFNFSLPSNNFFCGYLLNCVVGGHRGGVGEFLCKKEIYLNRKTGSLNFEITSSLDRGSFSGIFEFSTTPNSITIRINNMSSTQRQDFGICVEIVGSGTNLVYPIFSGATYA